jgi:uncharacterized protein with HEPN domain
VRDDRERLQDVLEAIERIEKYAAKGRPALDDELIQTWIIHHLMSIGEACRALSPAFRTANSDDIWNQAAGLRNVIVHEYFGIDHDIVWGVVERDLPDLRRRVVQLLST